MRRSSAGHSADACGTRGADGTLGRAFSRSVGSASDAGFTFLELLVALTILLVTVVAATGLMVTSTYMTSAARQKSAMVNAAAGYLERVRQQSFSTIGTPGGDPAGDLVPLTTADGLRTVTITPQVQWGRPEDPTNHAFKTVTVTVAMAGDGGAMGDYASAAVIGEAGSAATLPVAETTPTVVIESPLDGAAVWGNSVSIVVSATANSLARTLTSLGLYDDGTVIGLMVASGQAASGTFRCDFSSVREGLHAITPTVTDSNGSTTQGPVTRLLVDNIAPNAPGSTVISIADGSSARVWWNASADGTAVNGSTALAADHYAAAIWQQPSSTTYASDYTKWTPLLTLSQTVMTAPTSSAPLTFGGLTGFSRFAVSVRASSPDRGASAGLLSAATVVTGITHPTLVGTWTATRSSSRYTVNVTLSVPIGPTFPWSSSASTRFYRLTSATQSVTTGTLLRTVSSSNPSWTGITATDAQTTATNGTPKAYWYGAVTTLTPQGYGASSTSVQSCVIGPPADMVASGAQGMVFGRW
jgi:prepilin-type N-terminal cleavage/methylation domain-containing protein